MHDNVAALDTETHSREGGQSGEINGHGGATVLSQRDSVVPMSDGEVDAIAEIEGVLDGVDAALARLLEGTYRTCDVCGEPIADELLEMDPLRTTCSTHPRLTD
jgi:DksA/TraR C4-type zinc finger protein